MMKVIHLIHGLSTGGAETLVKDYVLKINKKDFEPIVLAIKRFDDSPYEKLIEDNGVKIIYVSDYVKFKSSDNIFLRGINKVRRHLVVRKILCEEKPDIIHSHLNLNSYLRFAKIDKSCRLFHTVHSEPQKIWDGTRQRQYDFKCLRYLVRRHCMRFIVLHEKMRKEVNEMFNVSNSIILNNGIDFSRFNKDSIKDCLIVRKELKINKKAFVIGHVGRFSQVKNHSFLIDVFYEIYKKNNDAFLLLIGAGEYEEKIVKKLNKLGLNNNYLILANRNDIPNLLNIMDFFVFPSYYEGLPLTLIEAQKMLLPCLVSDKIPEASIISNLVSVMSLEDGCEKWANMIMDYKYPNEVMLDDKDWDINRIVKKLEKIYKNEI